MNPQLWPCLKGWTGAVTEIVTSRAIYGKVHRAPTDYRWFAWSSAFGANGPAPLEHELSLGIEDVGSSLCCWRFSAAGAVAVKCYPSRAFDAAGRPAVIEKQILAANSNPALPPAAMAFFLLPATAPLDDNIWWPTWQDLRWTSLDYHLPIADTDCPVIRTENLEGRLDQAVTELLEAVPGESLIRFYAQLLAGNGLALLSAPKPVSPLALAALLLPLSRSTTEKIGLAGGIPSTRLDEHRLTHWNGVACLPALAPAEDAPQASSQQAAAADLVRKLERSISRGSTIPPASVVRSPGGKFLLTFLESPERWVAPGQPGKSSLPVVGPWPVVEEEEEAIYLRERVKAFLAEVQRLPNSDQKRHLETKGDLLRALVVALCPGPESLAAIPLLAGSRIPSLLFAGRIEINHWPAFARYQENFQKLADQSLRGSALPSLAEEVAKWLEEFAGRADAGQLQIYARQALKGFTNWSRSGPDWVREQ